MNLTFIQRQIAGVFISFETFDECTVQQKTQILFMNSLSLIFLFVVNICFLFSGICLNSLFIFSFWRSAQLRKKLCYFMIMVLSCCDLLLVIMNHSVMAYITMIWLNGSGNAFTDSWLFIYELTTLLIGFSWLALLVLNYDQYLATHHPIYHRTSVTKVKLFTYFAILVSVLLILSLILSFVISFEVAFVIIHTIFTLPVLFMNYKLFTIVKKSRESRRISPDVRITFSLKNISSCLLTVACFVALCIPALVYIGLRMGSGKKTFTSYDARLVSMLARTIASMNGTFNCLIFFLRNTVLRNEIIKVIKSVNIFRK